MNSVMSRPAYESSSEQVYRPLILGVPQVILEKVASVALSCILFTTTCLGVSLPLGVSISLFCSGLTALCEIFRHKSSSWFNLEKIDSDSLRNHISFLFCANLAIGIALKLLRVAPVQVILEHIVRHRDLILILQVTVIAPIVEEILFRGFLMERLEDLLALSSRYIYPIRAELQEKIGSCGQAIIFGLGHIGGATNTVAGHLVVPFITLLGGYLGECKRETDSLVDGTIRHMSINMVTTARALFFGV